MKRLRCVKRIKRTRRDVFTIIAAVRGQKNNKTAACHIILCKYENKMSVTGSFFYFLFIYFFTRNIT